MKKSIRRGLSLILATALMLCMIPAVGAETAETTTAPTYEYVFTMGALGQTASVGFDDTLSCNSETGSWSPSFRYAGGGSKYFFENGLKFYHKNTS
ncbi:MAG: hypothetical protein IJN97_03255, partial [Oscillospiraceae bacterium]|nr:hypothetical protein [Oscillospiraceae bacterium]